MFWLKKQGIQARRDEHQRWIESGGCNHKGVRGSAKGTPMVYERSLIKTREQDRPFLEVLSMNRQAS